MTQRHYGKYRGVVQDVDDRLHRGRIRVRVHDTTGEHISTWALPCVPIGGKGHGFFALPRVGDSVWIEYENGDIDHPIWVGCFWPDGQDLPDAARTLPPAAAVWLTADKLGLVIQEGNHPSLVLMGPSGTKITLDSNGIEITNGHATIKLANNSINLNDGALEVR